MRIAILLVLAVALCSCEPKPFIDHDTMQKHLRVARRHDKVFEAHQKLFEMSRGMRHVFRGQQASEAEVAACQANAGFVSARSDVMESCAALFSDEGPIQNATTLDAFCSTNCANKFEALLNNAVYFSCANALSDRPIDREGVMTMIKLARLVCDERDESGARCGLTLMRIGESSNRCKRADKMHITNEADCVAKANGCEWSANEQKCDFAPDAAFLGLMCNQCIFKMLRALAPEQTQSLDQLLGLTCLKNDEGQFCLPLLANTTTFGPGTPHGEVLSTICTTGGCVRKFFGAFVSIAIEEATKEFKQCVNNTRSPFGGSKQQCMAEYENKVKSVRSTDRTMKGLCAKQGQVYCFDHLISIMNDPCGASIMQGSCSTNCSDTWGTIINTTWGCCIGSLQNFLLDDSERRPLAQEDYPLLPADYGTLPPAPTGEPSNERGLKALKVCDGLNNTAFDASLLNSCERPAGVVARKVAKSIKLKILFSKIQSDEALKAKLIAALRRDVAKTLGLTVEEIVDGDLVEEATITVALSRRTTGTGVKFNFAIQPLATTTKTPEQLGSTLDSQQALVLTATTTVAKEECTGCVASSGSVGVAPSTGSISAATAATTGILTALVVAFLAL